MMPLQFFPRVNWNREQPNTVMFQITAEIKEDLRLWTSRDRLSERKSLHILSPDLSFMQLPRTKIGEHFWAP